jgi:L-aminopeptidase/D-esterase-like protein
VDAVLLTGGSAYGLDAAAGVMRWCEERGRGFPVGAGVVPIVPAAVIFDLLPCGRFDARPTPAMAYEACERAAAAGIAEGSVGAGTGATVGKALGVERAMKGGVGCAVVRAEFATAGAVAVVNAFGDVRDAAGRIVAGARADGGGFADALRVLAGPAGAAPADASLRNTTVALVVVDVPLGRVALAQLAAAAAAGLHRRVTPAGTTFDGDVVFALCPREDAPLRGAPPRGQDTRPLAAPRHPFASESIAAVPDAPARRPFADDPAALVRLEALAADALGRAVERAVRLARGRDGVPGLADGGAPGR